MAAGKIVAHSGKTGTTGGHYGIQGYPHLHLTTRKSPNGEFEGSQLIGPLLIYDETNPKPEGSGDPSPREKTVVIPYMTTDGPVRPKGTLLVRPVACQPG